MGRQRAEDPLDSGLVLGQDLGVEARAERGEVDPVRPTVGPAREEPLLLHSTEELADVPLRHEEPLGKLLLRPADLTVAMQAATIRATTGLKLPDATIVASALLARCEVIVCNDERWKKRLSGLYRQFTWLCLADYL